MSTWFSSDALQLVEARNRREVAAFSDLIASHQQLLFRGHRILDAKTETSQRVRVSLGGGVGEDKLVSEIDILQTDRVQSVGAHDAWLQKSSAL
ncbi:Hypothetical protein PHPALM_20881, partial [Phytophthora palmivora]